MEVIITAILLALTYGTGKYVDRRHYRYLEAEERRLSYMLATAMKTLPSNWKVDGNGTLVTGSVVIGTDYFKNFISAIMNLFGGNLRQYEIMMDRGRREAIVRMLRDAERLGANAVWNVRIETMMMGDQSKKQPGGAEFVAYGTAMKVG